MHGIQNSYGYTLSHFNKTAAYFVCAAAIATTALAIIRLSAFKDENFTGSGIVLGISTFVLVLDLVWIAIRNHKKTSSVPQPQNDPVKFLPQEIVSYIFSYHTAKQLCKNCLVNKQWYQFASDPILWSRFDLKKLSSFLSVIDGKDWANHVDLSSLGLSVDNVSKLNVAKIIEASKKCYSYSWIEANKGFTVLTIPKGLTWEILEKIGKSSSLKDHQTLFRNFPYDQKIFIDKAYEIVITNTVFEKSRSLPRDEQIKLLAEMGFEMSKAFEVATLIVATNTILKKGLYDDDLTLYTRCAEANLIVGGFNSDGILVDTYCVDHMRYGAGGNLKVETK